MLYRSDQGAATLFIEQGGFTWCLAHPEDLAAVHDVIKLPEEEQTGFAVRMHAIKVSFEGALGAGLTGQELNEEYFNYFIGSDPDKWASYVRSFRAVRYAGVWEGIGLRAYSSSNRFKYDFIVAPGADAGQVRLRYAGAEALEVIDGDLVVRTSVGDFIEKAPYAYQMIGSSMVEVACAYQLSGDEVTFVFPDGYDSSKQLIIDPIVIASTLSGATGSSNYGHCATYDIAGNIYTGAINFGSGYPTTPGAFQMNSVNSSVSVAISKLNPTGSGLIWASLLGGGAGDYPHSLVASDQEELFVYGSTTSTNFPTTAGAFSPTNSGGSDLFVSRFSADGASLLGSSYLGGSGQDGQNNVAGNYGDAYRGEIVLDVQGRPVVASFSSSVNFPVSNGAVQTANAGGQDAVLFCLSANMSNLVFSTYLGSSGNDAGFGLRVTPSGTIYTVGCAGAANFPSTPGAHQPTFVGGNVARDGFVARLNATATQLEACTFWATNAEDKVFFIDLDNAGDVWVFGQSAGDIPVTAGAYNELGGTLFLSKYNPMLSDMPVSTRVAPATGWTTYGGAPVAFLVDRCDNVYISTHQVAANLPTTDDAVYTNGGFYLAAYGPDCETLEFSTYYTGNHVDGGTSRFDKSGIVYQGVCSGGGFATNPDAWSSTQPGWDIGVFKIDFQVSGVNASLTASAEALNGCAPHTVDFNNYSVGNIFEWDFGDGSPASNDFEPSHTYQLPGLYDVRLISMDSLSCNIADTAYVQIAVSVPQDFNPSFLFSIDCDTYTLTTNNTTEAPWLAYTWNLGDGTVLQGENITHVYAEEGEYTITLVAEDLGCINDEEVTEPVIIGATVTASVDPESLALCGENTVTFSNTSNGVTYLWDFGDGSPTSVVANPVHTFNEPGEYEVTLTAFDPVTCNLQDQTTLTVVVSQGSPVQADFQLVQTDCDLLTVNGVDQSLGEYLTYSWSMGDGASYATSEVEHNYAVIGQYSVSLTVTDTVCNTTDTFTLPINVLNEVTAIIGNDDLEACAPYTVQFVNNSAGSSFVWDFGDGSPEVQGQIVQHLYQDPGEYTVTLTVEGSGNCGGIDVTTAIVTVIEPPLISALFTSEQFGACEALSVNFSDASSGDDLIYQWNIDGVNYGTPNISYVFQGAGSYNVSLTVSESICDGTDTYSEMVVVLAGIDLEASPDQYFCYYESSTAVGVAGPPDATYLWNTGDQTPVIIVEAPGVYTVTAMRNNCIDVRVINVIPIDELHLMANPTTCEGISTALRIAYEGGSNYQWCDGLGTAELIYADQPGEYCYSFNDQFGCTQHGKVVLDVVDRDARVYIPNAFTPNNDGVNDVFKAYGVEVREFALSVWNRWGDKVFETNDLEGFWDGSYQGGDYYSQNEVYTWEVEYRSNCSAEKIQRKGYVVLMR